VIDETINIEKDDDIVKARQLIRKLTRECGFDIVNQTKLITVISELTRNVLLYAHTGILKVKSIEKNENEGFEIIVSDQGPGIDKIELALSGGYSTSGGLGKGLVGTKKLMDEFEIKTELGKGTEVRVIKWKV
jgi:serine/threonine-protein kinase RsbT